MKLFWTFLNDFYPKTERFDDIKKRDQEIINKEYKERYGNNHK